MFMIVFATTYATVNRPLTVVVEKSPIATSMLSEPGFLRSWATMSRERSIPTRGRRAV